MDCSQPGSSVRGISQARTLEWVAISFSRESSQPRDWTWVSCIGKAGSLPLGHQGSPEKIYTKLITVFASKKAMRLAWKEDVSFRTVWWLCQIMQRIHMWTKIQLTIKLRRKRKRIFIQIKLRIIILEADAQSPENCSPVRSQRHSYIRFWDKR